MKGFRIVLLFGAMVSSLSALTAEAADDERFPPELVKFVPYDGNPVFAGTGKDTWDRTIRERGYIMREGNTWHLWCDGYYHGNADPNWKGPWTTNVAVSEDLVHWTKYPGNPIIATNHSSATLVHDGNQYRLYTAHPDVRVYFPAR